MSSKVRYTLEENVRWQNSLPNKRVSSKILVWHPDGERLMFVKPNYRDYWQIPGGVVESNESPLIGGQRELYEETGLKIAVDRFKFAGVNYSPQVNEYLDFVHFFYSIHLSESELQEIKIAENELEDFKFLTKEDIKKYLPEYWHDVHNTFFEHQTDIIYAESGHRLL